MGEFETVPWFGNVDEKEVRKERLNCTYEEVRNEAIGGRRMKVRERREG